MLGQPVARTSSPRVTSSVGTCKPKSRATVFLAQYYLVADLHAPVSWPGHILAKHDFVALFAIGRQRPQWLGSSILLGRVLVDSGDDAPPAAAHLPKSVFANLKISPLHFVVGRGEAAHY